MEEGLLRDAKLLRARSWNCWGSERFLGREAGSKEEFLGG
jgi:hypothetical protein